MKQSAFAAYMRALGVAVVASSAATGCSATAGPETPSPTDNGSSSTGPGRVATSADSGASNTTGPGVHPDSGAGGEASADGGQSAASPPAADAGASPAPDGSATTGASADGGALAAGDGAGLPPLPSGAIDLKLPMPPRQEWDTDVGWCGEAAIQTVALHYGAWISQQIIRAVAGAPVVFGSGGESVMTSLHLTYAMWDYASASNPEYQDFMVWMKGYLARGIPTIFAEYVQDHNNPPDPDYDHLVPGIGIRAASADSTTFDPNDVLYFDTNEGTAVSLSFGSLAGDRTCAVPSYKGGCVPTQVDYGVAVTGIVDPDGATLPVEVSVNLGHEPNPTSGETPTSMKASVTVSGLTAGRAYSLLRYNDYTKVPTSGAPAGYLGSAFDAKVDFTAASSQWSYDDPASFLSNTAVYYRCVPN